MVLADRHTSGGEARHQPAREDAGAAGGEWLERTGGGVPDIAAVGKILKLGEAVSFLADIQSRTHHSATSWLTFGQGLAPRQFPRRDGLSAETVAAVVQAIFSHERRQGTVQGVSGGDQGSGVPLSASFRSAEATCRDRPPVKRRKPGPKPGGAKANYLLTAALTQHHRYDLGRCSCYEPISVAVLARSVGVSPATASRFFTRKFKGYSVYKVLCIGRDQLDLRIQQMNDDAPARRGVVEVRG
jgi:hypothetical protein